MLGNPNRHSGNGNIFNILLQSESNPEKVLIGNIYVGVQNLGGVILAG